MRMTGNIVMLWLQADIGKLTKLYSKALTKFCTVIIREQLWVMTTAIGMQSYLDQV